VKNIGVLAIQGDFNKHAKVIKNLAHQAQEIRRLQDLKNTDGLIIPGGESTTFFTLFNEFDFIHGLKDYARNFPIMGTCAGLIILSQKVINYPFEPLGLIDITVERNAYGRQRESFIDDIQLSLNGKKSEFPGVFIRAPKIQKVGDSVRVLARHKEDAVLVSSTNILAATFHPELTKNYEIHQYFVNNFIY
jgi:5'-phosphate synthase pdxT subunit